MEKRARAQIDTFWFNDYLKNRSQQLKINNKVLKTLSINFGVPQGSVLGPILFNIFVNDLTKTVTDCDIIQYADNTQFIHTGSADALPDLIERAEVSLSLARTYFNTNGLMLNTSKTQCIFIGTKPIIKKIPTDTKITFNNTFITPSTHVKNLGVTIDSHMSFDVHIKEMYRKVMGHLLFLNKVKDKFDKDTRKIVVESIALSTASYCLSMYGTNNSTLLRRVQQLQNFAAKICGEGARRCDHATPFITQLEWLKIEKKVVYEVAVHVFKIMNKLFPEWYMHLPTHNEVSRHTYTTRHRHNLHVPLTHTDSGGRSLTVLGPKVWNDLPQWVKDSNTLASIKNTSQSFPHGE